MKIKGEVMIEGIRLVVDIEAPDDDREIFVTNLGPSFLTIPKQRWPVEYLEISDETVSVLKQAGVHTLADIVDNSWQLMMLPSGLEAYHGELTAALKTLRSIALTFEAEPEEERQDGLDPFPIPSEEEAATKTEPAPLSLDGQLGSIGVSQYLCVQLEKTRNVKSIRELLRLGRRKLVMTNGLTISDIETIEQKFKNVGIWWDTPLEENGISAS